MFLFITYVYFLCEAMGVGEGRGDSDVLYLLFCIYIYFQIPQSEVHTGDV